MRQEIFLTNDFENRERHYRLNSVVDDFLHKSKDINELRNIEEYDEWGFYLPNENFPRVIFKTEVKYGIRLFVARMDFHDENKWLTYKHHIEYSNNERKEINEYFLTLKTRPILPEDMKDYEKRRNFSNTLTSYVYEMREWCVSIQKKELDENRGLIFKELQNIVIDKVYDYNPNNWSFCKIDKYKLWYYVKELEGHTYYFLLDISDKEDISYLDKYAKLMKNNTNFLLQSSCKGYPDWVLCMEYSEWKDLEFDDKCNLALSQEEIEVLNRSIYPIFINGLAGSGKSTTLYYFFSHIYLYYVINARSKEIRKEEHPFLFLTYSEALKNKSYDSAKSLIKSLLYSRYDKENIEKDNLLSHLEGCFYSFRDFLRTIFLNEDERQMFLDENHIDIVKFKDLYDTKCTVPKHQRYSYIKIWSAIRNIKGKKYIDTDNGLYEYYKWYTTLVNNGENESSLDFWDDLSLIKYVVKYKIDNHAEHPKYNIIFCDEAQDFTEIEIYIILNLSKYTDYDLSNFTNLPLAFAGDPNQTISPTGFDWSHLKNIFNESFEKQVGTHIQLSDKTLKYNYRSKAPIVKLANSLQYINKCFLSEDTLKPQQLWNSLPGKVPVFFFIDENKDLLEKWGFEKCFTITGDDGEYRLKTNLNEFTEDSTPISDPMLKGWLDSNKDKMKNILTPLTAKGLEYSSVLLYKIADSIPESFSKIFNNEKIEHNTDEWFQCSSFLTKLYIAVSRAKDSLYIFDTKNGYDKFWKYFVNHDFVGNLLQIRQETNKWSDEKQNSLCGGIKEGIASEFKDEVTNDFNPLQIAINLKSSAIDSQGYLRAAGYYQEAGYEDKAGECIAWSYYYDNKYKEAGDKFANLNGNKESEAKWHESAVESYWRGCCWNELETYHSQEEQSLLAQYMKGNVPFVNIISEHPGVLSSFKYGDLTYIKIADRILNDKLDGLGKHNLPIIIQAFEDLSSKGFNDFKEKSALLYYSTGEWKKAINKWDEIKREDDSFVIPNEYNDAQEKYAVNEDRVNDIILWKSINGKTREILKYYGDKSAIELDLTPKSIEIIFNSFIEERSFSKALNYKYYKGSNKYQRLYDLDKTKFLLEYILNDNFKVDNVSVSSSEKYYEWIENKVKNGNTTFFDSGLPKNVVKSIFNSECKVDKFPIWYKFMSLRDIDNHRVFAGDFNAQEKPINLDYITESLLNKIKTEHSKYLDSCFVEIMFNRWYNYERVRPDAFLTLDWNNYTMYGNDYFKDCGLLASDLEVISQNMRIFISKYLSKYVDKGKFNSDLERDVKVLLKAYEKAVPRNYENPEDPSKLLDNWQVVVDFCKKFADKFSKWSQTLMDLFLFRGLKIGCSYKSVNLSDFYNLLGKCSIENLVKALGETNLITLSKKILNCNKPSIIPNIAKLVYSYDLKVASLKDEQSDILYDLTNQEIDMLLSSEELNDDSKFNLKLVCYLFEQISPKEEIVGLYQEVANNQSVSKDKDLVEYFKKRPLSNRRPIIEYGISNSTDVKYETINQEQKIGNSGITINPQGGRLKKVEFFEDDEIATIKKGKLDEDYDDKKVAIKSEKEFVIANKIYVIILSENEIEIRYDGKYYKIMME